jgi:hypothetical protein
MLSLDLPPLIMVDHTVDPKKSTSQHQFSRDSCICYLRALVSKQTDFMPIPTFLSTVQDNAFITPRLRTQYVDWFYDENEKMGFDCETPAIAINYLERYLSIKRVNKQELLIAMYASFLLAIRVHESVLVAMSSANSNEPSMDHVKMMEADILQAISWRVHPVTSYCIARNVLALLPFCKEPLSHQRQEDVEILLYFTVGQYDLLHETPATLALAAILAATLYSSLPTQSVWDLIRDIGSCIDCDHVNASSKELLKILTLYDEPAAECLSERENTESPTGVEDIFFDGEHAVTQPHPMSMMPEDLANCRSVPISEKRRGENGRTTVSAKKPRGYTSPFESHTLCM